MRQFGIDTALRQAAFLAQIAHESAELNVLEENLSYAPGRLTAVWPKRFPNAELARPYSRNPEKLANAVYANRLGNGDEASRDGYRFRGRGLIQVTGRDNYKRIGELLKIDLINMPDTLLEPRYAALSAGAFWKLSKWDDAADTPGIADDTRAVSGGLHGLEQRQKYYDRALEVFGGRDSCRGVEGDSPRTSNKEARPEVATSEAEWFE
jgi:putative chitinase